MCYYIQEYEYQDTDEAKFVKDLDRFDMVMQAFEYEQKEQRPGFLQEFFDSTEGMLFTKVSRKELSERYLGLYNINI